MAAIISDTDIITAGQSGTVKDDRLILATLEAIGRSQAIIEMRLDGTILTANENFLKLTGYSLAEIKDQNHRIFVSETEHDRPEYLAFWEKLRRGEAHSGEFLRIAKGGKQIWMQASYSPVLDSDGNPVKVVKSAFEITKQKLAAIDAARVEAMVDNSPINTMYADRDLVLRYMNKASLNTLRRLQDYLPVPVDQIVGKSIDIFHRNPSHQRKVLSSPDQLPRRANFQLGPETVDLLANAIRDHEGNYVGTMVTWEIVTERIAADKAVKDAEEREKRKAEELQHKALQILSAVRAASHGDLTTMVNVAGDDAMGQIGAGLQEFFSILRTNFQVMLESAKTVGTSSEELNAISQQMTANAQETASQATTVGTASSQVSLSVNAVAASSHQMGAAIHEIAKSASEAARVAHNAVDVANATNATISQLGDSSSEIGKVIKVITSIAQQTNLLALNATIEAARAGEAGKGFAVVASEVKDLAKETARATEEIGQRIEAIQTDSKAAVGAIKNIGEIIKQINDLSATIASAVEEQTATTNEIGRSVSEAARGTTDIVHNIKTVAQAAHDTTEGAAKTKSAALTLSEMAISLRTMLESFKV